MIPLTNTTQRVTLVCSLDPAVTLKALPETDEAKAEREKAGLPVPREARKPIRWLRADGDPDDLQVDAVGADALRVTVRIIDSDEAADLGLHPELMTARAIAAANFQVTKVCVLAARGPALDKMPPVDTCQPAEVQAWLKRVPLIYRSPLGEWVIDESCGYNHPFVLRGYA